MKHRWPVAAAFALLLLFFCLASAQEQVTFVKGVKYERIDHKWFTYDGQGEAWEIAPGEVSIKFKNGVTTGTIQDFTSRLSLKTLATFPGDSGFYSFRYDKDSDPVLLLERIVASEEVEHAVLDTYLKLTGAPNDPFYADHQWDKRIMGLERAWDITTGDPSVTIAVIDIGVQYDHEDLAANVWSNPNEIPGDGIDNDQDSQWLGYPLVDDVVGWDFHDNDNDPMPTQLDPIWRTGEPHGTACAGTVLAVSNNNVGIAGVAGGDGSDGPKLVSLRADTRSEAQIAVSYCWNKGIDIVSMSFGADDSLDLFAAELDRAYNHGVLLFAAIGNLGPARFLPAVHPRTIGVGASDENDERWSWSSWGSTIDVMAPAGGDRTALGDTLFQWTTDNDANGLLDYNNPTLCLCPPTYWAYFSMWSGTSAACPAAAGVAALLLSYNPSLTNAQVEDRLEKSAVDMGSPGFDIYTGYGRVDAYRALTQWGTIYQNTTWGAPASPQTIYVSGDVTVAPGKTLTINPGTTIYVAEDDNEHTGSETSKIEFNVEGFLDVNGTETNPVVFRSWTGHSTADWVGFYVDGQSTGASFDHCSIKNAEVGIDEYESVTVTNCTIDSCATGLLSRGGNLVVTNSDVRNCGIGIDVRASAPNMAPVIETMIEDCAYGISSSEGGVVYALASDFHDNEEGIHAVGGVSAVTVSQGCTFEDNALGISCYGSLPRIYDSEFDNNSTGIHCNYFSGPTIQGNTIQHSLAGIACLFSSSPRVRSNEITYNTTGVLGFEDGEPDLGTVTSPGNNHIQYNTGYHVWNQNSEATIMAENNFCRRTQSPCLPKAGKFYGLVDYDPALCENPLLMAPGFEGGGEGGAVEELPGFFALGPCVPNPFNPSTTIRYDVPKLGATVELRVYNVSGQLVRTLVSEFKDAGYYRAVWDGKDGRGAPVASSVYFVRMSADGFNETRKIVLVR